MSGRSSILIGFTPTHLIPMLEIAPALPEPIFFFHPEAQRIPRQVRPDCIYLGGCDRYSRSRARKYLSAGLSLRRLLGPGNEALVCVPHPFNPLSNYAFFAPGTAEVRIYQDGILNYYDAGNPFVDPSVLRRRRLKAAAALLPFKPYAGHLSGMDARDVSMGYFTHPQIIVQPERFAQVTRLRFDAALFPAEIPPSADEPAVMFLDQPIERLMAPRAALLLREQAFDFADSLGRSVIYKPHYTQEVSSVPRIGWRMLSSQEAALPAEEIPASRPIEAVVSFCSSALANIRLSRPEVRCVAIGASAMPIKVDGEPRTMADLFRGLGVETVD